MRKARKRLDRFSFWKRVSLFILGYVPAILLTNRVSIAFEMINLLLMIWLAVILAWRFRDIGWPVWLGPSIVLVATVGLGLVGGIYGGMHPAEWTRVIQVIDSVRITGGFALLLVAGCVPGRPPETDQIAGVFD